MLVQKIGSSSKQVKYRHYLFSAYNQRPIYKEDSPGCVNRQSSISNEYICVELKQSIDCTN